MSEERGFPVSASGLPRRERGLPRREFLTRGAGLAAGFTVLGAVPVGCGDDDSDGGSGGNGRIAFGQPDRGADVYPPLIAGAKEAAAELGYEVVESFSGGEVDAQVEEINTWIAQGLDAIVVLPQDENAIAPLVKKSQDAGIPFIAYSSPVPGADGLVAFDHKQAAGEIGQLVGDWINDEQGGEAEVALLTFDDVPTGRQRVRGAEDKMKQVAPGAKVVAEQQAILAPEALEAAQSMLQANPNIGVFICIADDGCLGVRQAFNATGRDPESVFVTGYDGAKQVLQRLNSGSVDPIKATAALDLEEIGRKSIEIPANILAGSGPTEYLAPYVIVTPEDTEELDRLIAAYGA